ncbi:MULTISPECIES: sensor histidine kinase [Clostridium]|uniref:sensor histidine kinase n=1 Tax=Clostridium TaxID=1485 RepID=UPI000826667E|nr:MULTISPECIES: GHKL domain-containing protein [Clostridium]PJI08302.1 GHKL domain-containing protein [Clostridium sp. CT7]
MEEYFEMIITILSFYLGISNLCEEKCIKIKDIIVITIMTVIISWILVATKHNNAVTIVYLLIGCAFVYIKVKNVIKSVAFPICSLIIIIIWDYLLSDMYMYIFFVKVKFMMINTGIRRITSCIIFIGTFIITKLIGKFLNKKMSEYNIKLEGKIGVLVCITFVLTFAIFYINIIFEFSYGINSSVIRLNGILFFSYFILLVIIMYILIGSVIKEMKLNSKENEFQSLQQYTSRLEKLHKNMRSFRHDYINILLSMFGYIQDKDIDGLEKYFNDKVMPLSKAMQSNNFKISLLQNIAVPEIKGLFSAKIIRAQEIGIDVYIDIAETVKDFNMDIIDLSRVTGILLDNAIEAAEKCDKPSMKVALVNKEGSILIVIINNYKNEIPPIYKIFERGFSTKGDNRGIGLNNLREIIRKYENVSLDTIVENGQFKQIITIGNNIERR